MLIRKLLAFTVVICCCVPALAKHKNQDLLPADVLRARTVLVIVDPDAGLDAADPNANRRAREDVEQALDEWGRFRVVQEGSTADLVIVVRKGNGKIVQPTIGGTPANGIPPVDAGSTRSQTETVTRAGVRWGRPGMPNDPSNTGGQGDSPHPQIEAGSSKDTFVVYRGNVDNPNSNPLDSPAVWRYSGKNALEAPKVPAVAAFRKLIVESEKQLASKP